MDTIDIKKNLTLPRRSLLKGMAAAGTVLAAPGIIGRAVAQSGDVIKLGAPFHRTGIGAAYGRWYERTALAAVKLINEQGGINGLPVELIIEDDGTDPKRGVEAVEKMPYFLCSEAHSLAAGAFNRYVFQPSISDVKSQVSSMAPWITDNLGKKVTMIYPDYAFGYDHRDNLTAAIKAQGGEIVGDIAIPPTETSYTRSPSSRNWASISVPRGRKSSASSTP